MSRTTVTAVAATVAVVAGAFVLLHIDSRERKLMATVNEKITSLTDAVNRLDGSVAAAVAALGEPAGGQLTDAQAGQFDELTARLTALAESIEDAVTRPTDEGAGTLPVTDRADSGGLGEDAGTQV